MEDEPCRKRRPQVRFRRSKKRRTTLSANGRSGWFSESVNWMPISRRSTRQVLRALTNHLQSSAAIRRWIKEANNV
jgi:hypothetical protein